MNELEVTRRRGKYDQIARAQGRDLERVKEIVNAEQARADRAVELKPILAALQEGGLAAEFRAAVDKWSRKPGYGGFNSPNGQMFVNQLVGAGEDEEVAGVLRRALVVPASTEAAQAQLAEAVEFVTSVRKGAYPTPTRVPFLCSFFWGLQEPQSWPIAWPTAVRAVVDLAWLEQSGDLAADYLAFREVVHGLGAPPTDVAHAFFWFDTHRFVGLDPSLVDRCARGFELVESRVDGAYRSVEDRQEARLHARAVLAELRLLGRALQDDVATAIGRSVKAVLPDVLWGEGVFRADGWMYWRVGPANGAGIRVWATLEGLAVGVYCGHYRPGWYEEVPRLVEGLMPTGTRIMAVAAGNRRLHPEEDGSGHECLIGWWFPGNEMLDRPELAQQIIQMTSDLQPVVDALLISAEQGRSTDGKAEPPSPVAAPTDELLALKAAFLAERKYPTDKDDHQRADRERLAEALAPGELMVSDLSELRSIINTGRYGRPGPMSGLNKTLSAADPDELKELLGSLDYLCWGDDPVEDRIDVLLDPEQRGVSGLGESVILKLLAITDPERFLPVFPYAGDMGKARMLKLLDLPQPDIALSRGNRQVAANDLIRKRLDPLFPGDPWAQAQFLYWLNAGGTTGKGTGGGDADELAELADRLLVPKSLLEDIVALLASVFHAVERAGAGTSAKVPVL